MKIIILLLKSFMALPALELKKQRIGLQWDVTNVSFKYVCINSVPIRGGCPVIYLYSELWSSSKWTYLSTSTFEHEQ